MFPGESCLWAVMQFPAPIIDSGLLDHVTCFGQWDISKHEASRGSISGRVWGLAFLEHSSETAMSPG